MKERDTLSKIQPYKPGKTPSQMKALYSGDDYLKLSSNENVLGPPKTVKESLQKTLHDIALYPDKNQLIEALSNEFAIPKDHIIIGNGSDEVLLGAGLAYLNPGDQVISSTQTFSQYRFIADVLDAEYYEAPMTNDRYDLTAITKAVTPKTKLIFIANPNNPTGTIITQSELRSFMNDIPETCLIVLDEAYQEYATHPEYPQTVGLYKHHSNILITRTFSKLYGLAGLRVGYGISNEAVIRQIRKTQQPFNVNQIALSSARLALSDKDHIKESIKLNTNGKSYLYNELNKLNLTYIDTQANFILIDLPISGDLMFDHLCKKGIIVRSLSSFGRPNAIRVTIGTQSQNERFINALTTIIKELDYE